jgi:hypothetical protein
MAGNNRTTYIKVVWLLPIAPAAAVNGNAVLLPMRAQRKLAAGSR